LRRVLFRSQRLVLASEDHRHAQLQSGHDRRSDTGGFDGDDLGDPLVAKAAGELLTDLLHQQGVDLMVQESVDLEYPVGEYDTFTANFLFQLFHERATSSEPHGTDFGNPLTRYAVTRQATRRETGRAGCREMVMASVGAFRESGKPRILAQFPPQIQRLLQSVLPFGRAAARSGAPGAAESAQCRRAISLRPGRTRTNRSASISRTVAACSAASGSRNPTGAASMDVPRVVRNRCRRGYRPAAPGPCRGFRR